MTKQQRPTIDELGFSGTKVILKPEDSVEQALKRFKKICIRDNIMIEWKEHRFYESPSVKRKKKSQAAQRKMRRKNAKANKDY